MNTYIKSIKYYINVYYIELIFLYNTAIPHLISQDK